MTKHILHPDLAEQVTTAFVHATAARWSFPRVQVQDREPLVLVSVDTQPGDADAIEPPLRKSITQALNQVIPEHPDHKFGLWMVVFLNEGKMYETLHPSEFHE